MARRYTGPDDQATVLTRLAGLTGRLDTLEATVADYGLDIAALGRGLAAMQEVAQLVPGSSGGSSSSQTDEEDLREWMTVTDPQEAAEWLRRAQGWLVDVGVHHKVTPAACWPLHPEVVAEVFALDDSWAAAYAGGAAVDVSEWLTRWLPTGRDRIGQALAGCRGEHTIAGAAYQVHDLDLDAVAGWWTTERGAAPEVALSPYLHLSPR